MTPERLAEIEEIGGENVAGWVVHELIDEARRLRAALEAARRDHAECDDPYYECPMLTREQDYDASWRGPRQCHCGADEHNARIEAALNPSTA